MDFNPFTLDTDVTDSVSQSVAPQIAITAEHLAARRTLVRFQIGVRQQMSLQIGTLVETARANGTLVRRFFQVQNPVHGQRSRLAKAFAAITAFEWLLFRMNITENRIKHKKKSYTH